MRFLFLGITFFLLTSSLGFVEAVTTGRLFVLKGKGEIEQYKMEKEEWSLSKSYTGKDFASVFPAASIEMKSGNILCVYDEKRTVRGRLHYDPSADALREYQGDSGDPADPGGQILETPLLGERFRRESALYTGDSYFYRATSTREEFQKATQGQYQDIFVLEGHVFGLKGDRIDRLSRDAAGTVSSQEALVFSGSDLTRAAVSPWQEAFLSDPAAKAIQRVRLFGGSLQSNGSIKEDRLKAPGGLEFNMDGELFVANRNAHPHDVLHFKFVLDGFRNWRARPKGSLDLGNGEATDLTLARPVGFVVSERTHPPVKLTSKEGGGHIGISQSLLVHPILNSESAVIALVEYEPGGFTPVHYHTSMEQVEVVVAGRALWEVGEKQVEVGPGDVIFCGRWAKHGYQVLGDTPFRFLQLEWTGVKGE